MKHYILSALLLAGLAGCGGKDSDPTHTAVTAYLQKSLDDPASYQSVRWGKERAFTQRDVNIEKAADQLSEVSNQHHLGVEASNHYIRMADLSLTPREGLAELDKAKRVLKVYNLRADSVHALYQKLLDSADSTRLGTVVTHAFRAKNKMGALVLDSAVFTVLNTGKIEVQKF